MFFFYINLLSSLFKFVDLGIPLYLPIFSLNFHALNGMRTVFY